MVNTNDIWMSWGGQCRRFGATSKGIFPNAPRENKHKQVTTTSELIRRKQLSDLHISCLVLNHPKDKDLIWKIKKPGETSYTETSKMPFDLSKDMIYNKNNLKHFRSKINLNEFFS